MLRPDDRRRQQPRQGIDRRKELYAGVVKRLQELDAVRDYGSYDTHILAAPERGRWVVKKALLVCGFGVMGGLLAGLAWACLAEISDPGRRRPEEVGGSLNVPVTGHIPPVAARMATDSIPQTSCDTLHSQLTTHQAGTGQNGDA